MCRHHLQYQRTVSPFLRVDRVSQSQHLSQSQLPPHIVHRVIEFPVGHLIDVLMNRLANEPLAEVWIILRLLPCLYIAAARITPRNNI